MVLTPLLRGLLGIDVDAPRGRMTLAPHLPAGWDSVAVDNVPVGRNTVSFTLRRTDGMMTAVVRRHGPDRAPLELVFSPALPLGAKLSTTIAAAEPSPGDLHATVRASLADSAIVGVRFSGGWSIIPPVMPATIGSRSRAPRVVRERLGGADSSDDRYVVALEGLSGQRYAFKVRAPDDATARALAASASAGATVALASTTTGGERILEVTFPTAGANPDGYTMATVTFTRAARP